MIVVFSTLMKQVEIYAVEMKTTPSNDQKIELKVKYHITLCSEIEKKVIEYNMWGKLY